MINQNRRRDPNGEECNDVIVLLRFCLYDTTAPQNDNFPLDLEVFINGKSCELPVSILI